MKVEFRNSFIKDLKRVRDKTLKARIKGTIELVEQARNLQEIEDAKSSEVVSGTTVSGLESTGSVYF